MQWKGKCVCLVFLALTVAGCRSLKDETDFEITLAKEHSREIDPIKKEQKIKVEVTSSAPVSVYIYLKPDQDAVNKDVLAKRPVAKALASKEKVETASLEATIPADATAVVTVYSLGKAAKGKLKITN
jgi:hypothetical protein